MYEMFMFYVLYVLLLLSGTVTTGERGFLNVLTSLSSVLSSLPTPAPQVSESVNELVI